MSILNTIDEEINKILLFMKQISEFSKKNSSSNVDISLNKNTNSLLTTTNNNIFNNSSLKLEDNQNQLLTLENFSFSHLCNRDIRDLPLSKEYSNDFDHLRSCYILTMTDLIGRFLIHKTSDEFRQFLIEKVQCSQSFTDEIIQLMNSWTLQNLQIGKRTLEQSY